MSNISWNEIQDRAVVFASKWEGETYEKGESQTFWSDFLAIYGIDRRRHGAYFEYAIKKRGGKQGFIDMFWPGKILAEQKSGGRDLGLAGKQAYEYLETMPDHDLPTGIVVSDFETFQYVDLETREKTEFSLKSLPKYVKLFAFLIDGVSKSTVEEEPVNRKAAEAMAKIHNQLRDDNYTGYDLEILLVRLVFCMFADDSGIFDNNVLNGYLVNHTSKDGSDLGPHLMQIFETLNTPSEQRQSSLSEEILSLPYINGGLFKERINTPNITSAMRTDLLKAMELDWSKVSPAIFGSMFQGVMDEEQRHELGAHYTSEKNILRVIKPLFLDDLYAEFAAALESGPIKKFEELKKFQDKLSNLKFLDPACGCGNFLVITYRELRKLEHKVVAVLAKNNQTVDMLASASGGAGILKVNVDQMYGIEIEEFPALIAQTSLWLTDHQMNMEYSRQSGSIFKRLPLSASATIVNDNALTKDWNEIMPKSNLNYILGNPPFNGSRTMTKEQKQDLLLATNNVKQAGFLDFVTGWYFKAAEYIKDTNIKVAFVSTNSISQGEQVSILWEPLLKKGMIINFAHQTFKWSNEAKGVAAVYCIIIGFGSHSEKLKRIFEYPDIKGEPNEISVKNINPYLVDAPNIIVGNRQKPISNVPEMNFGNMPADGGNLILNSEDKNQILSENKELSKYIYPFVGAKELINGGERWCLWLVDIAPSLLRSSNTVLKRINTVRELRLNSSRPKLAKYPYLFAQITCDPTKYKNAIAIPRVSSENRNYIPIHIFDKNAVIGDTCMAIPNATLYHFAILTSRMHMVWTRSVAGRLESRYRYSKDVVYNNFVWPESINNMQKNIIESLAQNILDTRNQFPDATLADLYSPNTIPPELVKAHDELDNAVDKLYQSGTFEDDKERLSVLFNLYQKQVSPHSSQI